MSALKSYIVAALGFTSVIAASSSVANADAHWMEPRIPGTSEQALVLGRDLDGDGDPDEITGSIVSASLPPKGKMAPPRGAPLLRFLALAACSSLRRARAGLLVVAHEFAVGGHEFAHRHDEVASRMPLRRG